MLLRVPGMNDVSVSDVALRFIAPSPPVRVDQAVMPTPRGRRPPSPPIQGNGSGLSFYVCSEDDDRAELGLWT